MRLVLLAALLTVGSLLHARVETGLDVLVSDGFAPLWGKRVGVVTNHAALDRRGRHLIDLLESAPGVTLAAVFTPEHGLTGRIEHGRPVPDGALPSGVPVYSLYGEAKRPAPEVLGRLDALVCDLPDVGTRFYTYITTLGYAMEEAAKADKEFFVLDRPNPLGGEIVEGLILSTSVRHFTAHYSIPTRHGLTLGEIARWHNDREGLNARLLVIPMRGWKRRMLWGDTGLAFVPPSPNIPTPAAALLYAGLGAFEATNVSVGRGTRTPFEVFGAPWMKNVALARALRRLELPGVRFKAVAFRPAKDLYARKKCYGVQVKVTDPRRIRPVDVFVHAACLMRELNPKDFQPRWPEMPRVVGSEEFEAWYKAGVPAREILMSVRAGAESFKESRQDVLLYP